MKQVNSTRRLAHDPELIRQRRKQIFLSFPISSSLLKEFDDAIAEERQLTGFINITRSRIIRSLIRKWMKREVQA